MLMHVLPGSSAPHVAAILGIATVEPTTGLFQLRSSMRILTRLGTRLTLMLSPTLPATGVYQVSSPVSMAEISKYGTLSRSRNLLSPANRKTGRASSWHNAIAVASHSPSPVLERNTSIPRLPRNGSIHPTRANGSRWWTSARTADS